MPFIKKDRLKRFDIPPRPIHALLKNQNTFVFASYEIGDCLSVKKTKFKNKEDVRVCVIRGCPLDIQKELINLFYRDAEDNRLFKTGEDAAIFIKKAGIRVKRL